MGKALPVLSAFEPFFLAIVVPIFFTHLLVLPRPIKWLLGCPLADAVAGFTQRAQHGLLLCKRQRERGELESLGHNCSVKGKG